MTKKMYKCKKCKRLTIYPPRNYDDGSVMYIHKTKTVKKPFSCIRITDQCTIPPIIIRIPSRFMGELGFDNDGVLSEMDLAIRVAIKRAIWEKRGWGYSVKIQTNFETATALIQEMRSSSEHKTGFGVDPDCARVNREIVKLCQELERKLEAEKS